MAAPATLTKAPPIVRRLKREPTVDLDTAGEFLGIRARNVRYTMAERYRRRLAKLIRGGRPLSVADIKPRRGKDGSWAEIPNTKVESRIRCRSDLLLEMVYEEGVPW